MSTLAEELRALRTNQDDERKRREAFEADRRRVSALNQELEDAWDFTPVLDEQRRAGQTGSEGLNLWYKLIADRVVNLARLIWRSNAHKNAEWIEYPVPSSAFTDVVIPNDFSPDRVVVASARAAQQVLSQALQATRPDAKKDATEIDKVSQLVRQVGETWADALAAFTMPPFAMEVLRKHVGTTLFTARQQAEPARRARLLSVWGRLNLYAQPKADETEAQNEQDVETLLDLGRVLYEDKWQRQLAAIAIQPPERRLVKAIIVAAMNGDREETVRLIRQMNTATDVNMAAGAWLRDGLMRELLGMAPPRPNPADELLKSNPPTTVAAVLQEAGRIRDAVGAGRALDYADRTNDIIRRLWGAMRQIGPQPPPRPDLPPSTSDETFLHHLQNGVRHSPPWTSPFLDAISLVVGWCEKHTSGHADSPTRPNDEPARAGAPQTAQAQPPVHGLDQLAKWASDDLKGQGRSVIETLCQSDGQMSLAELAIRPGVNWENPHKGWEGVQRRLRSWLRKKRWRLSRLNNIGRLIAIPPAKDPRKSRQKAGD
jgi:hypothetical protein